jgi:hypothetical protein
MSSDGCPCWAAGLLRPKTSVTAEVFRLLWAFGACRGGSLRSQRTTHGGRRSTPPAEPAPESTGSRFANQTARQRIRPGVRPHSSQDTAAQASCGSPCHRTCLRNRRDSASRRWRRHGNYGAASDNLTEVVSREHPPPADLSSGKPASSQLISEPSLGAAEQACGLRHAVEGQRGVVGVHDERSQGRRARRRLPPDTIPG